jgi:glycosyltransferase involved in cell wall biosynthesis
VTVSVILPTHNPHRGRLARTLEALRTQALPATEWELVVVDNASAPALDARELSGAPANLRLVREPQLGLTAARRRGLRETRGDLVVFVDDDNVLAPDYLAQARALFLREPRLGAAGGRSTPEFEQAPPPWVREFDDLLACRDLGDRELLATLRPDDGGPARYPECAPIGAGMVLRRAAIATWLETDDDRLSDRRGTELSSSGDNDIVLAILRGGWSVGYFPALRLTHLIPPGRTERDYLARLNRGIARSWMQVLAKHGVSPWPALAGWTVPLRQLKAWFACRAWSSPAAFVRWQGACGHFEGRAALPRFLRSPP